MFFITKEILDEYEAGLWWKGSAARPCLINKGSTSSE